MPFEVFDDFEDIQKKGQSDSVYRRRIDNAMGKRKRTKGQTMIYKTLHRKLKIEQREPYYNPEVNADDPEG